MPSQSCPYKTRITDSSFVVRADVVTMRGKNMNIHSNKCVYTRKEGTKFKWLSFNLNAEYLNTKLCRSLGLIPGWVKLKIIELVFGSSSLSKQY